MQEPDVFYWPPTVYRQWILVVPAGSVVIACTFVYLASQGLFVTYRMAGLVIGGIVLFVTPAYVIVIRGARRILDPEVVPESWGLIIAELLRNVLAMLGAVLLLGILFW
jgi:hypothetical protein